MSDLTVPKRRVEVSLELAGGLQRVVTLFLSESAARHAGAERLSDVLNDRLHFVPALDADTRGITFLNCAAVMIARASADAERTGAEEVAIPVEHDVEVTLADGRALRGTVSYVPASARTRLVDFLNDGTPFLRLLAEDAVLLVNKRHVVRVAQVEP